MKAFCINLDDRTDRRDYMFGVFDKLSLEVERFSAVNGKLPEIQAAVAKLPISFMGAQISAGAYACFESHRGIWRRMCEENISHAVIFEDDLFLSPAIADVVNATDWPDQAEVIKLETYGYRLHVDAGPGLPFAGKRIHRLRSTHFGTGSYALTQKAAERLLALTEGFNDPIDHVMFDDLCPTTVLDKMEIYQMTPSPVTQGQSIMAEAEMVDASWRDTSIEDRFGELGDHTPSGRETKLDKLKRRLREEIKGRLRGTRYIVVPYG